MNTNATALSYGTLLGRGLMGLLFVFSGVGMLTTGVGGVAGMITDAGLPLAAFLAWVVVVIKIAAGAALIVGYKVREAALGLIIFTALTIFFFHMDLEDINLFKNLAIIGGLLYVHAYGPGQGWKLKM